MANLGFYKSGDLAASGGDGAGVKGDKGDVGASGKSAYQVAVDGGYAGTQAQWLASLKGADGKSAYQVAVDGGYVGTQAEWVASLKGAKGDTGKSAYQVAVDGGYAGTQARWLASLKGSDGRSAYQIAVAGGYANTEAQWLAGLKGADGSAGKSAYQLAVDGGFVGTQAAWLASLKGKDGTDGTDGTHAVLGVNSVGKAELKDKSVGRLQLDDEINNEHTRLTTEVDAIDGLEVHDANNLNRKLKDLYNKGQNANYSLVTKAYADAGAGSLPASLPNDYVTLSALSARLQALMHKIDGVNADTVIHKDFTGLGLATTGFTNNFNAAGGDTDVHLRAVCQELYNRRVLMFTYKGNLLYALEGTKETSALWKDFFYPAFSTVGSDFYISNLPQNPTMRIVFHYVKEVTDALDNTRSGEFGLYFGYALPLGTKWHTCVYNRNANDEFKFFSYLDSDDDENFLFFQNSVVLNQDQLAYNTTKRELVKLDLEEEKPPSPLVENHVVLAAGLTAKSAAGNTFTYIDRDTQLVRSFEYVSGVTNNKSYLDLIVNLEHDLPSGIFTVDYRIILPSNTGFLANNHSLLYVGDGGIISGGNTLGTYQDKDYTGQWSSDASAKCATQMKMANDVRISLKIINNGSTVVVTTDLAWDGVDAANTPPWNQSQNRAKLERSLGVGNVIKKKLSFRLLGFSAALLNYKINSFVLVKILEAERFAGYTGDQH